MLAVSPLSNTTARDERDNELESFALGGGGGGDDFPDFVGENLLDSIDFDDLFVGINDGDVLPDLEMDTEIFAEFSISSGDESDVNNYSSSNTFTTTITSKNVERKEVEKAASFSASDVGSGLTSLNQGEEIVSTQKSEESAPTVNQNITPKESDKGKKSSGQSKNNLPGKRKVKVDWTPELHRRFVQAVEHLGVDKAVPSRILEIMGIDCLTRHNIASHLQKYRSHRKHLQAREAEAASWSHRRQIYGGAAAAGVGGGERDMNPWPAPTIGFPPPMAPPIPHHFRPLHVWGHPSVDQSYMHMWPKHLAPLPSPQHSSPAWVPAPPPHLHPPPPSDPSFWHPHHQRVTNSLTPGTPYFPAPILPTRYPAVHHPVPGIPPAAHAMYKVDPPGIGVRTAPAAQPLPKPPCDFHPSKESIDAAIGDVLSKPWLPLPLGLKPPAVDSVLGELQRQGVPKIPPTCA